MPRMSLATSLAVSRQSVHPRNELMNPSLRHLFLLLAALSVALFANGEEVVVKEIRPTVTVDSGDKIQVRCGRSRFGIIGAPKAGTTALHAGERA